MSTQRQWGGQAELVMRSRCVEQRGEATEAVGRIVDDRRRGILQAEIRTISVHTGVISEATGVAAEVELVIGLIEVAGTENEFGFVVALKAGARRDVENAVSAVAVVRGVAAALRLHGVNVFWVHLRA